MRTTYLFSVYIGAGSRNTGVRQLALGRVYGLTFGLSEESPSVSQIIQEL